MNASSTKAFPARKRFSQSLAPAIASHTFNELALLYVANHAQTMSSAQLNRRISHLGQHLLSALGSTCLTKITVLRVQKCCFRLEFEGMSTKDIKSCMASFRACLKYAVKLNWPVPADLLKALPTQDAILESTARQHLSHEEFSCLYQDLMQDLSGQFFH